MLLEAEMKNLATLFKALSDETRLSMMNMLLRHGELCVCDFVGAMEMGVTVDHSHRFLQGRRKRLPMD